MSRAGDQADAAQKTNDAATNGNGAASRGQGTPPASDVKAALDFLHKYESEGPWVLTAIAPDRKGALTGTFYPHTEGELAGWLDEHNGVRNIYYSVNPTLHDVGIKAKREEIKEVRWLHLDLDPRVGEAITEERERILNVLRGCISRNVPLPTIIVFSGGGYQGLWRLAQPIPIHGSLERAEEAKLYNLQLERIFEADHCHNIDRIMRLPGTVNLPNAKKLKAGRARELATLIEFHSDRVYPLSRFAKALLRPTSKSHDLNIGAVVTPDAAALSSVEAIRQHTTTGHQLPLWFDTVVVEGDNPHDPYRSRSEALFAVCCEMVRAGIAADIIYAVITDPQFKVSASVLDKGSGAARYARKQIRSATECAINPQLQSINEQFAVVGSVGGKCRVIDLTREDLELASFEDFSNRFSNVKVSVGRNANGRDVTMPLGKWWLGHEMRRQYDRIEFNPGLNGEDDERVLNLWRGFTCQPRLGDCSLFKAHVRDVICAGAQPHYDYLMDFCAHAVQRPWEPGQIAVVMRGGQGIGKGKFVELFGELFGRHFIPLSDPKHLTGSFNAHLLHALVVFADEMAGKKLDQSRLNTLITEKYIQIEPKGVNAFRARRYLRLFLASNRAWVVPADLDDRRFFVLDVSEHHKRDFPYFEKIDEEWQRGGREALLHELLERDLSRFNHRDRPETAGTAAQKLGSLSGARLAMYNVLCNGGVPEVHKVEAETGRVFFATLKLLEMRKLPPDAETALGRELRSCGGAKGSPVRPILADGQRYNGYWLPRLAVARRLWAETIGIDVRWPDDDAEWACMPEGEDDAPF